MTTIFETVETIMDDDGIRDLGGTVIIDLYNAEDNDAARSALRAHGPIVSGFDSRIEVF
jgi:Ribonuclease G/E